MKNYYEVLNIDSNATRDELKAYLDKLHQQTRFRTSQGSRKTRNAAEEELEIIEEAMEILLNDERRKEYDAALKQKAKIAPANKLVDDDYNKLIKTERTLKVPEKEDEGEDGRREVVAKDVAGLKPRAIPSWMGMVIILLVLVIGIGAYFTGGSFKKIDIRNIKGHTQLTEAVYKGSVGRINYLIKEKNASPNRTNRNGDVPLHIAAQLGDIDIIKMLINAGAKINARDKDGQTPLQLAIIRGNLEGAHLLIASGADVNQPDRKGKTPFLEAVSKRSYSERYQGQEGDLIEALLEAGADVNATDGDGLTPLHYAVMYDNVNLAKDLIDLGADINATDNSGQNALAKCLNNVELVKLLVGSGIDVNNVDNEGKSLLFYGIYSLEPVKILVEAGLDASMVDNEGKTPLFNREYDLDTVKYLVEQVGLDIHHLDNSAKGPLHHLRDGDVIKYLVGKGADINALDDEGRSPIFYVSRKKTMVELGADISIVDHYGRTPLYYENWASGVEYLVELGLDVNHEDYEGLTPLHYAVTQRRIEYTHIEKLLELGANVNAEDYEGNTPLETLKKHAPPTNSAQKVFGTTWHANIISLLKAHGGR